MRSLFLLFFSLLFTSAAFAQFEYEPSDDYPFGRLNPEAPEEVGDFDPLIGESRCESVTRASDQTWNQPHEMIWRWKYIMNGLAVQDETLRTEAPMAGSIRQFNADSSAWYVHYYSMGGISQTLPSWKGNKDKEGRIVLYREQKSPNGLDGFYRLTFYDITEESFEWIGEWVTRDESFTFPTWKISCKKIR
jgi:hypothetical protein